MSCVLFNKKKKKIRMINILYMENKQNNYEIDLSDLKIEINFKCFFKI